MPIYQTARYQVRPAGLPRAEQANRAFVLWLKEHEPGTLSYTVYQEPQDPTRFINVIAFQDEAAHTQHGRSEGVKRFQEMLYPELVAPVEFTEYTVVAAK
jgi:quinol monooxygenase YgiN